MLSHAVPMIFVKFSIPPSHKKLPKMTSKPCEAKVIFLADSAVGKTSIISSYSQEEFFDEHSPTVDAHFTLQRLQIANEEVKVKIWS